MILTQEPRIELLQGDCIELLKTLPDNSIDCVITDPPYNIGSKEKLTKVGSEIKTNSESWGNSFKDEWDSIESYIDWLLSVFEIINSKLKETGSIILFLDRKYTGYLIYMFEKKLQYHFKNKLYFIKNNPLPNFRKNNYRSTIEEAVWFIKESKSHFNFSNQNNMKQVFRGNIGSTKQTTHPTEKYEWMIKPLVSNHSYEKDTILDCFAGSGTTGKIAYDLGRNCIMIEKEPQYCEMITKRISLLRERMSSKKLF